MGQPAKNSNRSTNATRPPKLSPARRKWLNGQVSNGRFGNIDEALNFCVGQAVRVEAAQAEFDRSIAEGDKGPFERVNDAWWAGLRAETAAARTQWKKEGKASSVRGGEKCVMRGQGCAMLDGRG